MASDSAPVRGLSRLWLLAAAVLGILILGDLNRRMADARRLERDARLLQTQVAALESERVSLETQVAHAQSDLAVEEWARREARMVREGEHLVVPLPATSESPSARPTPTPPAPPPSPWEVWWQLFLGE